LATTTSELERFISDFERRMAPLERAVDEAWWNLATSGTDEAREEFVRAGKEYNGLFSDQNEYLTLRSWYENLEVLESPLLQRQVGVLYRTFSERQSDEEIMGRIEELEAEANAVYGNSPRLLAGVGTTLLLLGPLAPRLAGHLDQLLHMQGP
jgi:peptidyl-dipeptidase A